MSTIVITGATSGIGFETARELLDSASVLILIGRPSTKASLAISSLQSVSRTCKIRFYEADLGDQDQVRDAAKRILIDHPIIDVLINNAGAWYSDRQLSSEGVEMSLAVNYLAPFLLTHLLYPALRKAIDGRIINVSSGTHRKGRIYFSDLTLEQHYTGMRSYAQSKLALILFTYQFHKLKRDANVSINCLEPGMVNTRIGQKHSRWFHRLVWRGLKFAAIPLAEGARTSVYLATSPRLKGISGRYWANCNVKRSSSESYQESTAYRLWDLSLQLCGIPSYFPPAL